MSFRKEKKFRVTLSDFFKFQKDLTHEGMVELYRPRNINSVYFDTKDHKMFFDSEEGILPRKKVRVRWYNSSDNFTLEKKISSIEGRFKKTTKCSEFLSQKHVLQQTIFDPQYGTIYPTLLVSYKRSYFTLKSMRITFDENIKYKNITSIYSRIYLDPERVIEIKISKDISDDYVEKIIPNSTSRFSKYSRGLLFSKGSLSTN